MNLAPNGKPSNLTPEQYALVRTPAFKKWFGDWENDLENASKVVDENGEPLVLHRGNLVNQEELGHTFNLGHDFLKKGSGNTFGFFFTNNIDIAKKYMLVDHFDEIRGGSITDVFIKSNKILDLKDFNEKISQDGFVKGLIQKGIRFDNEYNYLEKLILDFDSDTYKYWGYNVFDYFDAFPELRNLFIKNGVNSVVFYEMSRSYKKYQVYVAFDSDQIKLADGTNTTFDGNNPDIRYANGGLIAPNGKPSNLTPEQYKLVRTDEFKAWFGDWENDPANASKVVDENGEPKVMWHGSNNKNINTFDINKLGSVQYSDWGSGFYFTPSKSTAHYYSAEAQKQINKKYNDAYEKYERTQSDKDLKAFQNIGRKLDEPKTPIIYEVFLDIKKPLREVVQSMSYTDPSLSNYAKEKLRDGILIMRSHNPTSYDELVVFNSTQIKLADGTNTTFDGNNPDIRYSGGGGVDDDNIDVLYKYLKKQKDKKIVFFTTSNRWEGEKYLPKSSLLAIDLSKKLSDCAIIDIAKLKIFSCEGNVSKRDGNGCGIKKALLNNKLKNPNNNIRCWASVNNETDEMYVVANAIFEADIVIFFGSIRWGKMNAVYTQIIERLTWLENRHTTLKESNLLKDKQCGVVAIGHNWNGKEAIKLEKDVLGFFGFKTPDELFFNWQFTENKLDESEKGYQEDYPKFIETFNIIDMDEDNKFKTGGYVSYRDKYNKKYGYGKNESHSLKEISKDTGVSNKGLQKIYNKGIGAFKTNPSSVRPNVKSKEQWAKARVYSAVMGGKAAKVDAKELKMNNGGEILLAPNGKPSNLTPKQYKLVRTKTFISWFGDWEKSPKTSSKVVDENGEPLVVRHFSQSNKRHTIFKEKAKKHEWSVSQTGIYFTSLSAKELNDAYNRTGKGTLYEVFLNIRNLLDLGIYDTYDFVGGKPVFWNKHHFEMLDKYVTKGRVGQFDDYTEFEKNVDYTAIQNISEKSKNKILKLGYHGLWGNKSNDVYDTIDEIVVFNSTQIKLADSTNTTFDGSNSDIRFDGGGYIGSCVDIGTGEKEVCEYFPNATIMAQYVGNPDENEWGKSKETTPKEFYKYVSKDDVPKKAINGEHTYHYIAQDGSNRDMNINETAIYFIYNIASDIHYFFKKTKHKTGSDLVKEPYISDNFQIGFNGAYEHTEENEIINQYADGVDLTNKLKKLKKPKGDCYYAAAQLVMGGSFKHSFGNKITYIGIPYLVHAEVRGQGKIANIRFGHAWVEDDENIYDYSNGNEFVMPKEIYYAIGDIDNQNPLKYQKYTFEEARRKMVTTRHYGEWDLEVDY